MHVLTRVMNDPVATSGVEPTGAIEFWHPFTDREANAVDDLVSGFRAKFPKVTAMVKGEQDDGKMIQATGAGRGGAGWLKPDGPSNIGNDPKWTELIQVFLNIHASPNTSTAPPSSVGAAYQDGFSAFLQQHQSGEVTDLAGGLKKVDDQIKNLIKLAG